MSTHDPISDLITRIRNAQMRAKSKVSTPGSKMRENVLEVLKTEGYIRGYATVEHSSGRNELEIELKYFDGEPVIREIERQIQRAEAATLENTMPDLDRPVGVPAAFADHAKLMFDLQILAFQADITRVITFQLTREQSNRTYPEIGVADPHRPERPGGVVDQVGERLRNRGPRHRPEEVVQLDRGPAGVQRPADRAGREAVDGRSAARLHVGDQLQPAGQLRLQRPGRNRGEVGLQQHVVDRLGQQPGQGLLRLLVVAGQGGDGQFGRHHAPVRAPPHRAAHLHRSELLRP